MIEWIVILLVVAAIASLLGLRTVSGAATGLAKVLIFLVLAAFLVALLLGVVAINL